MKHFRQNRLPASQRQPGRIMLTAISLSILALMTLFLARSAPEQVPVSQTAATVQTEIQFTISTTPIAAQRDVTIDTTATTQSSQVSQTTTTQTRPKTTITATAPAKSTGTISRPSQPTTAPPPPLEVEVEPGLAGKKLVALTFDDGPHKTLTPRLLDILKQEEVKATFFVVGSRAKSYAGIVKRAAEEGHQIGNHTYSHKKLTSLSEETRTREINLSADIIEQITGRRPTLMRPPYGAYNKTVSASAGAAVVLWSVDPQDWRFRNTATVLRNATRNVKDGDIILLHDIHATTIQAVEPIIAKLKAEGFTFVTVEELIAARSTLTYGKVYTACRK